MPDEPIRPRIRTLSGVLRGNGGIRIKPIGTPFWRQSDIYYQLIKLSWPKLAATFVGFFVCFNLIFAALYSLDPSGIEWSGSKIQVSPFWRAFFFSVDSVATIGYGNMYPVSVFTNVLVFVEIICGMFLFALITGIAFARFSRPTARVLFSDVAVITELNGVPTLMFRAANKRRNLVFEARATVSLLVDEFVEGKRLRRFRDLVLERNSTPVFMLSWTIMHPITSDSPLAGWFSEGHFPADAEIVVVLTGTDDRSGQTIYARWAYCPEDIRLNSRFVDILDTLPDGTRTIDYRRFHAFTKNAP